MLILEGSDLTQWWRAEPRQDESSNGRHQDHVPCQSLPPTGMSAKLGPAYRPKAKPPHSGLQNLGFWTLARGFPMPIPFRKE